MAVILSACTPVGSANTADAPVGVLLEASGGFPALELAISTRPKGLEDDLVPKIAGAIYTGLRSCRAGGISLASSYELRAPLALTFRAQQGKLSASDPESATSNTTAACLSGALSRAPFALPAELESLSVRLRATHPVSGPNAKAVSADNAR